MTARMARDVDALAGGRLTLGLGAGWQDREHTNFGFDLLDLRPRFRRFEESVQVVKQLLESDTATSFAGEYFRLNDAILLPRPARRVPILIGGNGEKRTLPFAARYADEWNATFQLPNDFARLNTRLDELLDEQGRARNTVRRSVMTGCVFGRDERELQNKLSSRNTTAEKLRERGIVVGTANQIVEQLGKLAQVGAQRAMLQWLDLDDLDGLEAMAKSVLPQL